MCDLTDPRIVEAYTAIVNNEPTNWLLLGYNDTRDVVSLYSTGTNGLSEFRDNLVNEVLYGFVRVDDRSLLITWVSEQVSGVRKARALVHSRSVAALLKQHDVQMTASTLDDLSDANVRNRLKLGFTDEVDVSVKEAEEEGKRIAAELEAQKLKEEEEKEKERQAAEQERERQETERLKQERERQRLEQERREQMEAQQRLEEEERILQEKLKLERLEQERIERERLEEEKKLMQIKLLEAEKNKNVFLSGFVSVQPSTSPFWKRRYFVVQGKSMAFYNDELQPNPVFVLDLNHIKRLSEANLETETFVPNAFVLETQLNGSFQMYADNKRDLQTILATLQTIY